MFLLYDFLRIHFYLKIIRHFKLDIFLLLYFPQVGLISHQFIVWIIKEGATFIHTMQVKFNYSKDIFKRRKKKNSYLDFKFSHYFFFFLSTTKPIDPIAVIPITIRGSNPGIAGPPDVGFTVITAESDTLFPPVSEKLISYV